MRARGRGCNAAILAAITVIPGVVFTGSNDGGVRALLDEGRIAALGVRHQPRLRTVNGVAAKGASISGPGPVVAGGMLYINSGYGALGGRPGNVLLAFGVEEQPIAPVAPAKPRDLEGVWSYATLTPFERPAELRGEFFTDAQAAEFEAQTHRPQRSRSARRRRRGRRGAGRRRFLVRSRRARRVVQRQEADVVGDRSARRQGAAVDAEARARQAARNADQRDHPADGPENRSLQERCLAFNAGPPIGLGPYNNFLQIFQSRDAVVIYTEMIHDARIVWTDGRPHPPPALRRWLGDSRGRWEGNTLVVDTTNFTDKNPFRGSGEHLHLSSASRAPAPTPCSTNSPSTIRRRSRGRGRRSCR